jgi:prepilin-type N-terminal cleavage/methylation domain-containing protein
MGLKTANNKGFTLLELIIVMAIMGIIAAGVLLTPGILDNRNVAVDTSNLDAASKLQQQIFSYYITTGIKYTGTSTTLDIASLKTNKIISADTTINGNFILVYSTEGTPNVGFVLTSTKNLANSKCFTNELQETACSSSSYFFVPASGRLGSKSTTTAN